jgi:hypothetical protein
MGESKVGRILELNKIKNSVKQPKWTRYTCRKGVFPKRL